jgi:hypothetical protein
MRKPIKKLAPILVSMLFIACNSSTSNNDKSLTDTAKKEQEISLNFPYSQNVKDSAIINSAGKSVDILFNGVKGFLGGQEYLKIRFNTECMMCEPIQAYKEGFLFGKRLYFDNTGARYYRNEIAIPDTQNLIKRTTYYGKKDKLGFAFDGGRGSMKYQDQSCMDADEVGVTLKYGKGSIRVNKLINASFFEFDLDRDGHTELFLMGTRNCSQEVVVLRVR